MAALCTSLLVAVAHGRPRQPGAARDSEGESAGGSARVRARSSQARRGTAPGLVALHELLGRPLHTRAGKKSLLLKRVTAAGAALRAAGAHGARKTLAVAQYLVRVGFPRADGLAEYLADLAGLGDL